MEKKVSFNLPEETFDELRALSDRKGVTLTSVVRSAIETEAFFDNEVRSGSRVLLHPENGSEKEVIFLDSII